MRKLAFVAFLIFLASPARAQSVPSSSPEAQLCPVNAVNVANAEVGASYVNAATPQDGSGVMLGAGAGIRLDLWSFGARVRMHPQPGLTMFQLLAEVGIHPLRGHWDPYAQLHAGYVSIAARHSSDPDDSPSGLDLGLSLGTDYFASKLVSLGLDATYDILLFTRSFGGVHAAQETSNPTVHDNRPGYALIGSLHMGLHFDL